MEKEKLDSPYMMGLTLSIWPYIKCYSLCTKLSKNLLSVPAMPMALMAMMGADIRFDKTKCVVIKDDKEITIGHIFDDKLYRVNTDEYAHY